MKLKEIKNIKGGWGMKVALIGFGTVGRGAFDIIQDRQKQIKEAIGEEMELAYIVVRQARVDEINNELGLTIATSDYDMVLEKVDAVVEVTGAHEAGFQYMKKALENKVAVVTANKAVVSGYFEELEELSQANQVPFLYEAAVGGGIPVLTPLRHLLITNEVSSIYGILNGTCNYLLNKMFADDADYDETLKLCQDLGYAEKDPTDDVEAFDTMRKLRILTTMSMGKITEEQILTRGISQINKEVVAYAKENQLKIKLVAMARKEGDKVSAIVEPLILSENHPLAALPLAINTVRLSGNWVGDLAFEGPGAGKEPTGNAIVADLIDSKKYGGYSLPKKDSLTVENENFKARYLVHNEDLPEEWIENKVGNFVETKEILRKDLIEKINKDSFFARIEK